jgi:flavin-dependent dehydrogenase
VAIDDVVIVGAGPAGAVAATVLARAGARVRLLDRAAFPRDKLCGDTVNPGALAALGQLGLASRLEKCALHVDGMRVTGPTGVAVEGRYPHGLFGLALKRRDLDWILIEEAIAAGVQFDPEVVVHRAVIRESEGRALVAGVAVRAKGPARELRAAVTIGADGRRSILAFGLGLAHHPAHPRRWAIGAYYENVDGMSSLGEMHVRRGRYIGLAPLPGGLTNVCLVKPFEGAVAGLSQTRSTDPLFARLLTEELAADRWLCGRFSAARMVVRPVVLGPLAVDVAREDVPGLFLAGDAAGFIDPITGDGLRFAIRGGALAAAAALDAITHGWQSGVHRQLDSARTREFGAKWRFNRALRAVVARPQLVQAGAVAASLLPGVVRRVISTAGDCKLAGLQYGFTSLASRA